MRGGKAKTIRRALMLTLLTLIAVSVLVPLSRADWLEESYDVEGTWTSYYPDNFAVEGDNVGHWGALWDPVTYNFSAVHYRINLTDFGATLRSWSFSDFKKVTIRMDIGAFHLSGIDNFYINMTAVNQISWWGLTNDITVNFGGQFSIGQWRDLIDIYIVRNEDSNDTMTVRLSIWDLAGGTTQLSNGTVIQGYNVYWEKEYTKADPDFFLNPMIGALYVEHEGSGHFDFSVETTWYSNGEVPEIIEGINVPEVVETYEGWITDIFNLISGGVTFFIELLQTVGNILLQIAPYTSIILIFYILDVAFTSFDQRSFSPVGIAFMNLYEFLLKVWDGAIALGALIWDAITFWN